MPHATFGRVTYSCSLWALIFPWSVVDQTAAVSPPVSASQPPAASTARERVRWVGVQVSGRDGRAGGRGRAVCPGGWRLQ
eukprot:6334982-Prymnesium_polylepis.1